MNLGDKLIELRKDKKMSQDDLAETLGVTRQSISNWENYKNYPDINTIIKISNVFDISLDILLKGDTKMVSEIDKKIKNSKKYKGLSIILISIIIAISLFFGIYGIIYSDTKNNLEKNFQVSIKENNFKKNNSGYYSMKYSDEVTYSVPNQKMPDFLRFDLHFYAQFLFCDITLEDGTIINGQWSELNYYNFTRKDEEMIVGSSSSLNKKDRTNIKKLSEELGVEENFLKEIIEKGNELYKDFYK